MPIFDQHAAEPAGQTGAPGHSTTFYPTLLIGLGGTGVETMLRLKRLLVERGLGEGLHRFLFFDTDYRSFQRRDGLPEIDMRSEGYLIGVQQAEPYLARPDLHPHVAKRFPRNRLSDVHIRNLARGIGAGQIRSVGALALLLDAATVRTYIRSAKDALVTMAELVNTRQQIEGARVGEGVMIYIVGSLAGGTGSGCFLDVALLANAECRAYNPQIIGMFALPDSFLSRVQADPDQPAAIRANTYAALKELQFCLDAGTDVRNRAIEYEYGPDGSGVQLDPGDRVFKICYLVNDANQRGRLSQPEELYDLMARSIYQHVGSPFGADERSFQANVRALTGVAACPDTHRPRLFATVSTASLVYPARRVMEYWVLSTMQEVLHDHLLGTVPGLDVLRHDVTTFLQQNELDDRGASDQIINSLLMDESVGAVRGAAEHGLPRTFGARLNNREFVKEIERRKQLFDTEDVPKIRSLVDANQRRRVGGVAAGQDPIREALEAAVLRAATEHGVTGVRELLGELLQTAQAMREELQREIEEWRRNVEPRLSQSLSAGLRELAAMGWIRRLGPRDERLRREIAGTFNEYVVQRCRVEARPAVIDVIDTLIARTRDVQTAWETLNTEMRTLKDEAAKHAARLQTKNRGAARYFVVEQEITPPGYEQQYFEAHHMSSDEALAVIVASAGDAPALFSALRGKHWPEIGTVLEAPLEAHIRPQLFGTDIVQFASTDEAARRDLKGKVDLMFDMCQPFWPARPITAHMKFAEFLGISAKPAVADDGSLIAPPSLAEWHGGQYQFIVGHAPYEIVISRRTYGARASYLLPAADWRVTYRDHHAAAKGQYMLETHEAFADAPDLFPGESEAIEAFALSMALGFIAMRGNSYYLVLSRDTEGTEEVWRVLYESQWPTIHTLKLAGAAPDSAGVIRFERKGGSRWPRAEKLAEGRAKAFAALDKEHKTRALLVAAIGEYLEAVGVDTLKKQLSTYIQQVLETRMEKDRERAEMYKREAEAIRRYLNRIG